MRRLALLPIVAFVLACGDQLSSLTEPDDRVFPRAAVGSGSSGYQSFDLGTLGGDEALAYAINARGQIVGQSETSSGQWHAFLWDKGVMTDLGTLGGNASWAYGISGRGQVVGQSLTSSGGWHAFLWEKGVMRDLGEEMRSAFGVNERGQVVGRGDGGRAESTVGENVAVRSR
jgi:probable HAF family extracellular repeat protein